MGPFLRLILFLVLVLQASAASWKVTTWNLEWFPSGKPDFTDAAVEATRTAAAAAVLREIDPDVILLQEVRDEAAAQALAQQIGRGHQVVVVSRFKQGDKLGQQQQAILAKFSAKAAYWREWTTRQLVTPTRGFSFALFTSDTGTPVAVYSVHLKANGMSRDTKDPAKQTALNRLQRELAATQLVEHLADVTKQRDLAPKAAIVGGDFNTDPTQERFAEEQTLPTFAAAGLKSIHAGQPIALRTTIPAKGRYPDTTFDYLLLKDLTAKGPAVIIPNEVSDHRPVTITIEVP